MAALVADVAPGVAVTLSHEVSPTFREYERTSTTVVNAYVMTAVRAYLHGLQAALRQRGYPGRLFVMQSSGGVATGEAMERYPVRMIESGPAAGALMAAAYGELTGHRDLIAFDMGGTTAKLALIEGGRPFTTTSFELHRVNNAPGSGLPMNIQAIDLVEIGAGGGSIAREQLGVIAVGPQSASVHAGTSVLRARRDRADGDRRQPGAAATSTRTTSPAAPCAAAGRRRPRAGGHARAAARPVARGGCVGRPHDRQHQHGAGHARGVDRARPRSARAHAGGVRRLGRSTAAGWPRRWACPRVILPAAAGVTAAIGLLAAEVRFDVARTFVPAVRRARSRAARGDVLPR